MDLNTDSVNKSVLIIIDNSNEVFLKYYLRSKKYYKFKEKINFHELISNAMELKVIDEEILNEIEMFHKTRNDLYHDPKVLSVSKKVIVDFFKTSKLLYESLLGIQLPDEEDRELISQYDKDLLKQRWNIRFEEMQHFQMDIQELFGLTPNYEVTVIMATMPGYTLGGLDAFKTIFYGGLTREPIKGKCVRVLEFVNFNEENSWHDFFVSYVNSHIWYAIVQCFWSKWGKGDPSIERIHEMINNNKDKVEYVQSPRFNRSYHWKAYDDFWPIQTK